MHLCLSGNPNCSGINPCPDCFEAVKQRIIVKSMIMVGGPFLDRNSNLPGAFLNGIMVAWTEFLGEISITTRPNPTLNGAQEFTGSPGTIGHGIIRRGPPMAPPIGQPPMGSPMNGPPMEHMMNPPMGGQQGVFPQEGMGPPPMTMKQQGMPPEGFRHPPMQEMAEAPPPNMMSSMGDEQVPMNFSRGGFQSVSYSGHIPQIIESVPQPPVVESIPEPDSGPVDQLKVLTEYNKEIAKAESSSSKLSDDDKPLITSKRKSEKKLAVTEKASPSNNEVTHATSNHAQEGNQEHNEQEKSDPGNTPEQRH